MDIGGLTQKGAYTFKHDLRNLLLDIQKKMLHGFGNIHWGYALKNSNMVQFREETTKGQNTFFLKKKTWCLVVFLCQQ